MSTKSPDVVSNLPVFKLERFFAKYEFDAQYIACASDLQALTLSEVLAMADDECKKLWEDLSLMYTVSEGLPLLRQEITKQLYPAMSEDNLRVVCPQEGIYLGVRAILSPDDHVISISPSYQSLTSVAESLGCQVSIWTCKEQVEKPGKPLVFDTNDLEGLVQDNTKLLIVNFPHNPTGFLPSRSEWKAIIDFCKSHDIYLFSDEMYAGLESDDFLRLPPAATVYHKAVTLSGMSKSFAMPGIRIGWIASQDTELLERLSLLKDYTTICPPAPSEILALIGLRNASKVLERSKQIIARAKVAVQEFMDKHPDVFEYAAPLAGPIAFPKVIGIKNGELYKRIEGLVERRGILLLPGEVYGDSAFADRFRITLGRDNVPEIMNVWETHFNDF